MSIYVVQNNACTNPGGQAITVAPTGGSITTENGSAPTNGAPLGYSSIDMRYHYGTGSPGSPLSEQLSKMHAATSSITYTYPGSGIRDTCYDIWPHLSPITDGVSQREVMPSFTYQDPVVSTQSEMLTSAPFISEARLLGGGLDDNCPRDGGGVDGSVRIERRRTGGPGDSPMDILTRLPAMVVLERLPVPTLAMVRDGMILFANSAFAEMVGYRQDELAGSAFSEVFHTVPAAVGVFSGVDALANLVVELQHCEGWTVRARMSKSALMRCDDPVVLVTFENLTERLWVDEQ